MDIINEIRELPKELKDMLDKAIRDQSKKIALLQLEIFCGKKQYQLIKYEDITKPERWTKEQFQQAIAAYNELSKLASNGVI